MLATVMIAVDVAMATASARRGQRLVAGRLHRARTAARTSSTTNDSTMCQVDFIGWGLEPSPEPPPNPGSGLNLLVNADLPRQLANQRRGHRDVRCNVPSAVQLLHS